MITEDYCSFKVAELLKEKGFDEPCRTYYQDEEFVDNVCTQYYQWNNKSPFGHISAPTLQMAMKWLRENGIIIEILHVTSKPVNDGWFYSYQKNNDSEANLIEYPSYEEAVEAALKYSLKNLI